MITMEAVNKNNTNYLFQHSQFEYFEEKGDEKGHFAGNLARWQKLEGKEVTQELYNKYMNFSKDFKGVEIDPSAFKDYSILYNRADENEREQLKQVWNNSIKNLVDVIQQNTYYRSNNNGKTEYKLAKGVMMGVFNHHTSRPVNGEVDMQEHSHIVVFPKVLGQDGKFHTHELLDQKFEKGHQTLKYYDAVFTNSLAKGLNTLGYAIEPDKNGYPKISGIEQELTSEFSKRTNEINKKAGLNASYAEKKRVSLNLREKKQDVNLDEARSRWQNSFEKSGFLDTSNLKQSQQDFSKEFQLDDGLHTTKHLKTVALQQSTFSNKTFDECYSNLKQEHKIKSFNSSYSITTTSKTNQIIFNNYISQKSNSIQQPNHTSQQLKQSNDSNKANHFKEFSNTNKKGQQPQQAIILGSKASSINECFTDISKLKLELTSLRLDDPKRHSIVEKIGSLQQKIKQLEKQEQEQLNKIAELKFYNSIQSKNGKPTRNSQAEMNFKPLSRNVESQLQQQKQEQQSKDKSR